MKLRHPPYGKRIFEARRAGHHPLEVHVFFGGPPATAQPTGAQIWPNRVWLPPDIAPGTLDWRLVAGVPVIVWDNRPRRMRTFSSDLLTIAGEIADHAPLVWLVSHRAAELNNLAARMQALDAPTPWWPDERAQRYQQRYAAWSNAQRSAGGGGVPRGA